MEQVIYAVMIHWDYEGSDIIGIYKSYEDACNRLINEVDSQYAGFRGGRYTGSIEDSNVLLSYRRGGTEYAIETHLLL